MNVLHFPFCLTISVREISYCCEAEKVEVNVTLKATRYIDYCLLFPPTSITASAFNSLQISPSFLRPYQVLHNVGAQNELCVLCGREKVVVVNQCSPATWLHIEHTRNMHEGRHTHGHFLV